MKMWSEKNNNEYLLISSIKSFYPFANHFIIQFIKIDIFEFLRFIIIITVKAVQNGVIKQKDGIINTLENNQVLVIIYKR